MYLHLMKRSLSKIVVPDLEEIDTELENAQYQEDRPPPKKVIIEPDLNSLYEAVGTDLEADDLEGLHEKLAAIEKQISEMKDQKVKGVYGSINKLWAGLGFMRNEFKNLKNNINESKVDKAFGQSNRLYAWMKHVEKVQPNLALPEKKW